MSLVGMQATRLSWIKKPPKITQSGDIQRRIDLELEVK